MTTTMEAVVENGLLRPLQNLPFADRERVMIRVERIESPDVAGWLAAVDRHQKSVLDREGILPDSTLDIAEDRMRDA